MTVVSTRDYPMNCPLQHKSPLKYHSSLKDTDRCVMCGMCLPHCPTFLLTRNEGDSPRGRIMLMRVLDSGRLAADERMRAHIDSCLGCRACEAVCPSQVPYGRLLDAMRARLHPETEGGGGLAGQLRRHLLEDTAARRTAVRLLGLAQATGLSSLAGVAGGATARRALSIAPPVAAPVTRQPMYEARGARRAVVGLLTGCMAEGFDAATIDSAIEILTALGCELRLPPSQVCCGALDAHDGRPAAAARLMARNVTAFADPEIDAIAGCATGCSAYLKEYDDDTFAARAADLCGLIDQLLADGAPEGLSFAPLPARIAVHIPCSQRNVLREDGVVRRMLAHLPLAEIVDLPGNELCCGAAGRQMVTNPAQADALVAPRIAALAEMRPDLLVSPNVGCALHLRAALRRAGLGIEVVHPVTLLARQMRLPAAAS